MVGLDGTGEAGRCVDPCLTGGKGDTPESAPGTGKMTYWDLDGADETDGDFDGRRGVLDVDLRCSDETGEGPGEDLDFFRSEYFPLASYTSHCS